MPTDLNLTAPEVAYINTALAELEQMCVAAEADSGVVLAELSEENRKHHLSIRCAEMLHAMHDVLCKEIDENCVRSSTLLHAIALGIASRRLITNGIGDKTNHNVHAAPGAAH